MKAKHIGAFFRLIRTPNILMVIATQCLMRYCIIAPMLKSNGFDLQMSNFDFFLLVVATVCLTAGGYVINDYFDRKADLINRPDTVIVGLLIKRRWVMVFHIVFNSIGILAGLYLAYKIQAIYLGILFILGSGILWFYSTTYKKQLIFGNLIVSFSTGMVPVLVLLFELPLLSSKYGSIIDAMGLNANQLAGWIAGFAIFGFLISLIREIVKDTQDFEGDQAYGMQTLPIVVGTRWTKVILYGLILIFAFGLIYVYYFHLRYSITLVYLIIFQLLPLIVIAFLLYKADSRKKYRNISSILKIMMLTGILFAFIARHFIVNHYLII
ncbi:MAG: geranylgeranylglycerol-phosphate geranylgeranyltransferase [Bacteroidales bacterium]|nr:geranylgeranylglycerol-phosphate geranylgeranyltransferase [Bacteroidales bacterium]